ASGRSRKCSAVPPVLFPKIFGRGQIGAVIEVLVDTVVLQDLQHGGGHALHDIPLRDVQGRAGDQSVINRNIVSGTHPPTTLQFHEVGRIRGPEAAGSNDGNKARQNSELSHHAKIILRRNLKRKLQRQLDLARSWTAVRREFQIRGALAWNVKATTRTAFPVRTLR